MSVEAFSAVLHHSQAKGTEKVIMLAIAWHLSDDPLLGCWASQETLAKYANCSIRQVRRALLNLVESEELEIIHHGGNNYGQIRPTNRYFIRLNCPIECDSTLSHSYAQAVDNSVDNSDIADIYGKTGGHLR